MKTGKKGSFGPQKTPLGALVVLILILIRVPSNYRIVHPAISSNALSQNQYILFLKPSVLVFLHIFYTRALLRKDDCNSNFCLANALPYSFKPVRRKILPCS